MTNKIEASRIKSRPAKAAVAMRLAGASYQEIGEFLGVTPARAKHMIMDDIAALADPEDREILRSLEGERLNRLLGSVWPKAMDKDNPEHLNAIKTAVAVIERRARLFGLDAPAELVVYTPAAAEIDAWVASMAAQSAPNVIEAEVIVDG